MLKDSQIAKDLLVAEKLQEKLQNSLNVIKTKIDADDKDGLIEELFNYENLSEKMVNNARLLPIITGLPRAKNFVDDIIINQNNVSVCYTEEGWFYVNIPSLLTKKEKGDPSYIRATLNAGLQNYFKDNKKRKFREDCVIIFRHNYSKERTYREYRDHDNIELNAIVDMIALHVLVDDSPMKLKHFYCSCIDEIDHTEVFIVPFIDFQNWLNKYLKNGS